jgi:hypothetical protein
LPEITVPQNQHRIHREEAKQIPAHHGEKEHRQINADENKGYVPGSVREGAAPDRLTCHSWKVVEVGLSVKVIRRTISIALVPPV